MFDNLSDRLGNVFDRLRGRGALNEQDVRDAMREVRVALLEADVALPVVRRFIDAVTEKAIGAEVLKSVTPGQQVVKIVNDELVEMLGGTEVEGLKLDAIEAFSPDRVAGRILGMGDVVSMVEKAAATIKEEEAEALAKRMAKGQFDLNDLRTQLRQMQNMGGLGMLAGMLPGMKKAKAAMAQGGVDDKVLVHMDAIIGSMTAKERARPELMNAKRKKRVAAGSGLQVQDVNKLLKMHQEMSRAMKQIKKMGGLKGLGALFGANGPGGGMGAAMPGLGGPGGGMPPGLPGLPGSKK